VNANIEDDVDDGAATGIDDCPISIKRNRDGTEDRVSCNEKKPAKRSKSSTLEDATTSSATLLRSTQDGTRRLSLCGLPGGQRKARMKHATKCKC
jgi:hypothetical protein